MTVEDCHEHGWLSESNRTNIVKGWRAIQCPACHTNVRPQAVDKTCSDQAGGSHVKQQHDENQENH